jgi:hypothetical protein
LFDIISFGACANPSIFFGMFIAKELSLLTLIAATIGNLLAGSIGIINLFIDLMSLSNQLSIYLFIGLLLLDWTLPIPLTSHIDGPYVFDNIDMMTGCVVEGLFSFCYMLISLYALRCITNLTIGRSYYAIMIRILLIFGSSTTGASFNPMIGIARFCYNYNITNTFLTNNNSFHGALDVIKDQWVTNKPMQEYFYIYVLSPFIGFNNLINFVNIY